MSARPSHTAAPQVAGLILQVYRALHHLSQAGPHDAVGVEVIDDVSLTRNGKTIAQEQDKNSVRPGFDTLGDRSIGLWRTFQIWIQGYRRAEQVFCRKYFFVTNVSTAGNIITSIKNVHKDQKQLEEIIKTMRTASTPRSKSKIQAIISDVLSEEDTVLIDFVNRIEVVENYDPVLARCEIANGFGIDPGIDRDHILHALFGWLISTLKECWQKQMPGIISREACLRQCRILENNLSRQRLLPRPPSDLNIEDNDRLNVRSRPFVNHLSRVEALEEDVIQAIDHFIQFNIERHRLVMEGEIPVREWADRGNRLKLRWSNVVRQVQIEHEHRTKAAQGRLILAYTTYQHYEPLAGEVCQELYMTSGHYHRLADEDIIWWDPKYKR